MNKNVQTHAKHANIYKYTKTYNNKQCIQAYTKYKLIHYMQHTQKYATLYEFVRGHTQLYNIIHNYTTLYRRYTIILSTQKHTTACANAHNYIQV